MRLTMALICVSLLGLTSDVTWAQDSSEPAGEEPTASPTFRLDGDALFYTGPDMISHRIQLPCVGLDLMANDEAAYIACGLDGLLVVPLPIDTTDVEFHLRGMGGAVTSLFQAQHQTWAEVTRREARPVSETVSTAPISVSFDTPVVTTEPEPTDESTAVVGNVIEVESGQVVIDLGSEAGLERGDHIELFVEMSVQTSGGESAIQEDRVAIGEAVAVSETSSRVALGLNERVASNARARRTDLNLTGDVWAPARVGDIWDVGFVARPFLALGTVGVGMVSEVTVGYRFDQPLAIHLILDPVGIGLADEGNVIAIAGNVIASYDVDSFQVGLGLGWSAVNDELSSSFAQYEDAAGSGGGIEFDQVRSGLSIAQYARLGSRDGLHLAGLNSFILYDDEFVYGGTSSIIQVPLVTEGPQLWLIFRGGGGRSGYVFGEAGLRVLAAGNGDQGSFYITPTIGGASLWGEEDIDCGEYEYDYDYDGDGVCTHDVDYGGPMVGIGLEWRL